MNWKKSILFGLSLFILSNLVTFLLLTTLLFYSSIYLLFFISLGAIVYGLFKIALTNKRFYAWTFLLTGLANIIFWLTIIYLNQDVFV